MTESIGFIGLGAMGKPMAVNVLKKGFPLTVCDINPAPVKELVGLGAEEGKTPYEVAIKSGIIITMLYNDAIAKEVVMANNGLMSGFKSNSILIDMSTLLPSTGRLLASEAEKREGGFLGAPVTRGPEGAREGTLTIMVGGKKELFDRCLPLFQAMGKQIHYVGENPESGYVFKLVNNFLSTVHSAVAAEAMAFGVKAGADPEKLFEVISNGSGASYMFDLRVKNMLKGNVDVLTLPIQGIFKDLETITDYGKEIAFPMIFPTIAQQKYLEGMAAGIGRKDPSALVELYENRHNISVRKEVK